MTVSKKAVIKEQCLGLSGDVLAQGEGEMLVQRDLPVVHVWEIKNANGSYGAIP
jgi:hypothetical protein